MAAIDPAWIALIGTLCGGAGLKLMEHWLGRTKVKVDEAAKLRDELRIEITSQRDEIKQLEKEVNQWRREYYDLRDKYSSLNSEYMIALEKLRAQVEDAQSHMDHDIDQTPRSVID